MLEVEPREFASGSVDTLRDIVVHTVDLTSEKDSPDSLPIASNLCLPTTAGGLAVDRKPPLYTSALGLDGLVSSKTVRIFPNGFCTATFDVPL